MTFTDTVLRALDAGDCEPTSPVGVYALDRARDVAMVVRRADAFADYYGLRRVPRSVNVADAALGLVLLAMSETARGVRVLPARKP